MSPRHSLALNAAAEATITASPIAIVAPASSKAALSDHWDEDAGAALARARCADAANRAALAAAQDSLLERLSEELVRSRAAAEALQQQQLARLLAAREAEEASSAAALLSPPLKQLAQEDSERAAALADNEKQPLQQHEQESKECHDPRSSPRVAVAAPSPSIIAVSGTSEASPSKMQAQALRRLHELTQQVQEQERVLADIQAAAASASAAHEAALRQHAESLTAAETAHSARVATLETQLADLQGETHAAQENLLHIQERSIAQQKLLEEHAAAHAATLSAEAAAARRALDEQQAQRDASWAAQELQRAQRWAAEDGARVVANVAADVTAQAKLDEQDVHLHQVRAAHRASLSNLPRSEASFQPQPRESEQDAAHLPRDAGSLRATEERTAQEQAALDEHALNLTQTEQELQLARKEFEQEQREWKETQEQEARQLVACQQHHDEEAAAMEAKLLAERSALAHERAELDAQQAAFASQQSAQALHEAEEEHQSAPSSSPSADVEEQSLRVLEADLRAQLAQEFASTTAQEIARLQAEAAAERAAARQELELVRTALRVQLDAEATAQAAVAAAAVEEAQRLAESLLSEARLERERAAAESLEARRHMEQELAALREAEAARSAAVDVARLEAQRALDIEAASLAAQKASFAAEREQWVIARAKEESALQAFKELATAEATRLERLAADFSTQGGLLAGDATHVASKTGSEQLLTSRQVAAASSSIAPVAVVWSAHVSAAAVEESDDADALEYSTYEEIEVEEEVTDEDEEKYNNEDIPPPPLPFVPARPKRAVAEGECLGSRAQELPASLHASSASLLATPTVPTSASPPLTPACNGVVALPDATDNEEEEEVEMFEEVEMEVTDDDDDDDEEDEDEEYSMYEAVEVEQEVTDSDTDDDEKEDDEKQSEEGSEGKKNSEQTDAAAAIHTTPCLTAPAAITWHPPRPPLASPDRLVPCARLLASSSTSTVPAPVNDALVSVSATPTSCIPAKSSALSSPAAMLLHSSPPASDDEKDGCIQDEE
jgi:hypothetical protein